MEQLKERFERVPSYETALRIATRMFESEDFKEASAWARQANQLDREQEEAWMLYAKSQYALGAKDQAMSVLKLYLDYRSSRAASALLEQWEKEGN
jgi:thioredoxin-like negative regulator of GroEL